MAAVEDKKKEEKEEDPPIVKELKELDDKYLELWREREREEGKLRAKYKELQRPLLEERQKVLEGSGASEEGAGTPGCKSFWLKALKHSPLADEDFIQKWDEPVLEYLKDISVTNLDSDDPNKGCRVRFVFASNPYFTNAVLSVEVHMDPCNPYTQEPKPVEVKGCTIDWKAGKDVTVEKVQKQTKGKKGKQKKAAATMEPRESFFREIFKTIPKDGEIPEDLIPEEAAGMQDDDLEELRQFMLNQTNEMIEYLRDSLVPFAVRWYTGEAADSDDDEGEEEEEDSEEEDDSEDDDDEDDEPPRKGKGKGRGQKKAGAQKKVDDEGPDKKKEECKQQ